MSAASQIPRSKGRKTAAPSKRTKTRSFYIDERLLTALKGIATSKGVSVNSFVMGVLEDYVNNSINAEAFGYVSFPAMVWADLIVTLDEDKRSKLACRCAGLFNEVAAAVGYAKSLDSYLKALDQVVCCWSKWANYRETSAGNTTIITLFHKHGISWSRFLVEFVSNSIKDFVSQAQLKSIVLDSSSTGTTVRIPRDLLDGTAMPH